MKITKQDVIQAAEDKNIPIIEALRMMQSAAAKMNDESILEQLCGIKNQILFGDD